LNLDDENQRNCVLAEGPVGRWRVLPGTHTVLSDGQVYFDSGGEGHITSSSLKNGERQLRFLWRMVGSGLVECQPQHEPPLLDDDGQPETDDWHRICFTIERLASDVGHFWALSETNSHGFWELQSPVVPMD
jgi:hypothetical protein